MQATQEQTQGKASQHLRHVVDWLIEHDAAHLVTTIGPRAWKYTPVVYMESIGHLRTLLAGTGATMKVMRLSERNDYEVTHDGITFVATEYVRTKPSVVADEEVL